jgi:hypothetical protein
LDHDGIAIIPAFEEAKDGVNQRMATAVFLIERILLYRGCVGPAGAAGDFTPGENATLGRDVNVSQGERLDVEDRPFRKAAPFALGVFQEFCASEVVLRLELKPMPEGLELWSGPAIGE